MIDLNVFTFTGVIGYIEQKKIGNSDALVVVIYNSDDYYSEKNGDWVERKNRFQVTFYGSRTNGIFGSFKPTDIVWCMAKVVSQTKEDEDGRKLTNTYFNGLEIRKIAHSQSSKAETPQQNNIMSSERKPAQRPKSTWSKTRNPQQDESEDLDSLFE